MDTDEPITPAHAAAQPPVGVADSARLERIAGRLIGSLKHDPEYRKGDAGFVLLDAPDGTAAGQYGRYDSALAAIAALAGHAQSIAEQTGFRLVLVPVAGG